MDIGVVIGLFFLVFILLVLSSFYSFSEMAVASANPLKFKQISESETGAKSKKANQILGLIVNYNETVTSIVIFNNVVNILASTLATTLFTSLFPSTTGFIIAFVTMTTLTIIFGELLPKMLARKYPEKGLMLFRMPLVVTVYSLKFITIISNKLIKNKDQSISGVESKNELKYVISEVANSKHISATEHRILNKALELDKTTVANLYIKKSKTATITEFTSYEKINEIIKKYKYTRIPVVNGKKPIGVFNTKSFIIDALNEEKKPIKNYIYDFQVFTPQTVLSEIFDSLRIKREHMGIIINKKSEYIGLITLEDIIETVLGTIYDETDVEEDGIYSINEKTYILNATVKLSDFFTKELKRVSPVKDEKTTIEEWVTKMLKKSSTKDHFVYKNLVFWKRKEKLNKNSFVYEVDIL